MNMCKHEKMSLLINNYVISKEILEIKKRSSNQKTILSLIRKISSQCGLDKENRTYIREEFTRKKCKTAILLYCFRTAGVLHIFVLYKLLGPGTSIYRKSKINIKRKPNYEIDWFHN